MLLRLIAKAGAVAGLTTMMVEVVPTWKSVAIGGGCLVVFGLLVPFGRSPTPTARRLPPRDDDPLIEASRPPQASSVGGLASGARVGQPHEVMMRPPPRTN